MLHRRLVRSCSSSVVLSSATLPRSSIPVTASSTCIGGLYHPTSILRQATSFEPAAPPAPTVEGKKEEVTEEKKFEEKTTNVATIMPERRNPSNVDHYKPPKPEQGDDLHLYFSAEGKRVRGAPKIGISKEKNSVFEFAVKDANNKLYHFGEHKGKSKVLMIVNTASRCKESRAAYTKIMALRQKYKAQGLDVVAFPCDQLEGGGQEPTTAAEVQAWAKARFQIDFPVMDKVTVNAKKRTWVDKYKSHKAVSDQAWEHIREQKRLLAEAKGEKGSEQREKYLEAKLFGEEFKPTPFQMPTLKEAQGPDYDPDFSENYLYTYLKEVTPGGREVTENFTVFLVDREGKPRYRMSKANLLSENNEVEEEIKYLLSDHPDVLTKIRAPPGFEIPKAEQQEQEEDAAAAKKKKHVKFRGEFANRDMSNFNGQLSSVLGQAPPEEPAEFEAAA